MASGQLQSELEALTQMAEIRSPDGRLLGTFTPVPSAEEREAFYRKIAASVDFAELRRRAASEEGFSFEQVMEHIHSLEKSP